MGNRGMRVSDYSDLITHTRTTSSAKLNSRVVSCTCEQLPKWISLHQIKFIYFKCMEGIEERQEQNSGNMERTQNNKIRYLIINREAKS